MDAFLVLMQVGHGDDWTDRGVPEVVTGYGRPGEVRAAALQWLLDHYPNAVSDDWQLLVWTDVRDKPYQRDAPDVIIKPMELRAAGAGITSARGRRQALRPSEVVRKIAIGHLEIGDWILITQERSNTAAVALPGPWFPADRPGPDTVAARVKQIATMTWHGRDVIDVITPVGDLKRLSTGHPVIPIDETD